VVRREWRFGVTWKTRRSLLKRDATTIGHCNNSCEWPRREESFVDYSLIREEETKEDTREKTKFEN